MRRRSQPSVEALESLTMLSTVPGGHGAVAAVDGLHRGHAAEFRLQASGSDALDLSTTSSEPTTFDGYGQVRPLGPVRVTGTFHLLITSGVPSGTVTVSNSEGSVELRLKSPGFPASNGYFHAPTVFTYTIDGGTGAYAGASGHGRVHYDGNNLEARGTWQAS